MNATLPINHRASRGLLLATALPVAFWFLYGIVLAHPALGTLPWIPWQSGPPLKDLRILLDGVGAAGQGADHLHSSTELFNYPPTWLLLRHLGLSGAATLLVGASLGLLFLAVVVWNNWTVSVPAALVTSLCLISPPVLTALERGNNDLILFLLIALGGVLTSGWIPSAVSALLVGLAALLKLYPLVVFGTFNCGRRRDWILPALAFGGVTVILLLQHEAVGQALKKTPAAHVYSYGISVPARRLAERGVLRETWQEVAVTGGVALAAIAAGLTGFRRGRRCVTDAAPDASGDSHAFALSLAGGGIFVATYFGSASWLYRFIFLLWLIPALPWNSVDPAARRYAWLAGTVCVVGFWSFALPARTGFLVNQLSHVLLVGCVGFLLALRPPLWLRGLLAHPRLT